VNVRIETKNPGGGWDQPIVIVHPDLPTARRYATVIVDALYRELRLRARATVGDNGPDEPRERWGEVADHGNVEVVYERGG
jgi:hypothetical protein